MKKSKASKTPSAFIDFAEINDTLARNDDVLKHIQANYKNNMVKIGSNDKSTFQRSLTRHRP